MGEIRIGTSGWSYEEWVGVFYPDDKTPKLKYYSKLFNTVEVDSTFYAYPNRNMVFGWAKYTSPTFKFSLKIPKQITHTKSLDLKLGAEEDLRKFLDLLQPLQQKNKLGPMLIQLPPSFGLGKKTLMEEFLNALPKENKFAVEFRNKSWLEENATDFLEKYNVANTIVDEPLLPPATPVTADFTFIRWHGHGKQPWYNYRYSSDELEPWVNKVEKLEKNVKEVYGYFNNHFYGYAIENSIEFLEKLNRATDEQKGALERARSVIEGRPLPMTVAKGQTTLGDFSLSNTRKERKQNALT